MSEINTGPNPATTHTPGAANIQDVPDCNSAVSWAAILAGAAGAAALTLVLLILGSGFGFSVVSPWSAEGIGAVTLGFAAITWLTFTQLAASGVGGYLAGRLRTRWPAVHSGEVFFRDTAHGLLTWAVATLLMVALTVMIMGSVVSGGAMAGAAVADGAASAAGMVAKTAATSQAGGGSNSEESNTLGYYVDSLFRSDSAGEADETGEIPVGEVTRIFTRALSTGELAQDDKRHVGRLISQRTDLSQAEAERRVSESFEEVQTTLDEMETTVREAADDARKASALAALWITVSLLIGAFTASLMAVFGGRQRDA